MSALTSAELQALLGPQTANWHDLGVDVETGTQGDPSDDQQVTVRHVGQLVGFTAWSEEFPGRREFRAVIDERRAAPFPAGFMPPDPVRAQRFEQQRWNGGA